MISQCDEILAMLEAGEEVTPITAFRKCGTLALHSRVNELRERGYNVMCDMVAVGGGKRVGSYRLDDKFACG